MNTYLAYAKSGTAAISNPDKKFSHVEEHLLQYSVPCLVSRNNWEFDARATGTSDSSPDISTNPGKCKERGTSATEHASPDLVPVPPTTPGQSNVPYFPENTSIPLRVLRPPDDFYCH
ncbi:hypothetical protein CDAR_419251 [Caerostris darwini]|uniref:Uncharacterized protein n=1 Tax=Caerostris darwini TaxID=1538125 RepID=A0AAV4TMU8_9ARAC|nr:hypothetical protein CDAR_419251 [Caerostris darwini]